MPRAMRLSELCRSHLNIGCLSQRANHQGLETARTRPLPSHRGRASQRPRVLGVWLGSAKGCDAGCEVAIGAGLVRFQGKSGTSRKLVCRSAEDPNSDLGDLKHTSFDRPSNVFQVSNLNSYTAA